MWMATQELAQLLAQCAFFRTLEGQAKVVPRPSMGTHVELEPSCGEECTSRQGLWVMVVWPQFCT